MAKFYNDRYGKWTEETNEHEITVRVLIEPVANFNEIANITPVEIPKTYEQLIQELQEKIDKVISELKKKGIEIVI